MIFKADEKPRHIFKRVDAVLLTKLISSTLHIYKNIIVFISHFDISSQTLASIETLGKLSAIVLTSLD